MSILQVAFQLVRLSNGSVSHLFLSGDLRFPRTFGWRCSAFGTPLGHWHWKFQQPPSTNPFIVCGGRLSGSPVSVGEVFRRPSSFQFIPNRLPFQLGDQGEAYFISNFGQPPDFTWQIISVH